MLDLLIINPAAAHGIYGDLGSSLIAVEPPLWCRLIAGYVRDKGFSVQILDAEAEQLGPADVALRADLLAPRLVCLAVYGHQPSASTQQMDGASALAKKLKAIAPRRPIIMVGGHVAALPEQTLAEEAIDYACNSEGPVTVVGVLNATKDGPLVNIGKVPGLVYRDWWNAEPTIHVVKAPPLLSASEMHGDAWDLLPMHRYRAHNWQCFGDLAARQPYASIYTTLGCPYRCSFCCIQAPFAPEENGNSYRMRRPADVVAEIANLHHKYGVRTFKIVDEMFVLNQRHYTQIANLLIDLDLGEKINIWAYSRIDTVVPSKLALLRKAGIKWLALGIESGSAHVRDGASKALKNNDIVGIVRQIQAADINVIGNYIFGLPDDTVETMQQTLDLAIELNCEFANFYSAMAYPGSQLYAEAVKHGKTLPASWRGYSQHNDDCRPLDTDHVGAATVLRFRDLAFNTYFTNPDYLTMVERKFGAETLAHVVGMTKYQLKRKLLAA